jgi:hypothetical protein
MTDDEKPDQCPPWCKNANEGPHEHVSVGVVRSSVHLELLRYYGDDTTYVGLGHHMDGGAYVSVPLDVLLDLIGAARNMADRQLT